MGKLILPVFLIFLFVTCNSDTNESIMSEQNWRLAWRMIESSWDEKYDIAESQFDSLMNTGKPIPENFLISGLEIKSKQSKKEEILKILQTHNPNVLKRFCQQEYSSGYELCTKQPNEKIQNKDLQLKIIDLFVSDQAIRGNIMHDIIEKYKIDTTDLKTQHDWSDPDEISVDELNRNELKLIFKEYGFPTKDLIGRDAMQGVFLIIQHADRDKEWQKNQLPNLEIAAKKGDLPKQNYAFLYDRIKVNEGSPQRYGSQFENVDREKGITQLRETEKIEHLDDRRREMGMMPIDMYRRLMLRQ